MVATKNLITTATGYAIFKQGDGGNPDTPENRLIPIARDGLRTRIRSGPLSRRTAAERAEAGVGERQISDSRDCGVTLPAWSICSDPTRLLPLDTVFSKAAPRMRIRASQWFLLPQVVRRRDRVRSKNWARVPPLLSPACCTELCAEDSFSHAGPMGGGRPRCRHALHSSAIDELVTQARRSFLLREYLRHVAFAEPATPTI